MARFRSTLTVAIAIVLAFSSTVRTQSIIVEETQVVTVDPQQNTQFVQVTATSTLPVAATAVSTPPRTTYTAPTVTTTPSPTATPTATPSPSSETKRPSNTIIIVAAVGGIVVLAAVIMGIYFCVKSQRKKRRRHDAPVSSEFFEPVAVLPHREPTIPVLPDTAKGYRGTSSPPPMQQRQSAMSGMSGVGYPEFQEDKRHLGYKSNELHKNPQGDGVDPYGTAHSPPPGMYSPPPGMYSPPRMYSPPPGMGSPPPQSMVHPHEMETPAPAPRHELP